MGSLVFSWDIDLEGNNSIFHYNYGNNYVAHVNTCAIIELAKEW